MAKEFDSLFLDVLVKKGFLSAKQVNECLEILAYAGKDQTKENLLDAAIRRGFLTEHQASEVEKELARAESRRDPIPGFRLVKEIGRGGMGQVYRAIQLSLDREVAIKVLPSHLAKDPSFVERFHREAVSAGKLLHPNVVQVIQAGVSADNHYYMVMEFVEGESVHEILDRDGKLSEEDATKIVRQIAEALCEARRLNLIHRDIKPANILVTEEKVAKLADFGLAREITDNSMTQTGMMMGTPNYMSPEQVRGRKDLDVRTDIYSLGATFYHMVTGRLPFIGDSPTEILLKHIEEAPIPPKELNPELSDSISQVILQMMEKDCEQRYLSPEALLDDLDRAISGEDVATLAGPVILPPPLPDPEADLATMAAPTPLVSAEQTEPAKDLGESPPQPISDSAPPRKLLFAAGACGFLLVLLLFALSDRNTSPKESMPLPQSAGTADSEGPKEALEPALPKVGEETGKQVPEKQTAPSKAPAEPDEPPEIVQKIKALHALGQEDDRDYRRIFPMTLAVTKDIAGLPQGKSRAKLEKELNAFRTNQLASFHDALQVELSKRQLLASRDFKTGHYSRALAAFDTFPEALMVEDAPRKLSAAKSRWEKRISEETERLLHRYETLLRNEDLDAAENALNDLKTTGLSSIKKKLPKLEDRLDALERQLSARARQQQLREEENACTRLVNEILGHIFERHYETALRQISATDLPVRFPHFVDRLSSLRDGLQTGKNLLDEVIRTTQNVIQKHKYAEGRVKGIHTRIFKFSRNEVTFGQSSPTDRKNFDDLLGSDLVNLARTYYRPETNGTSTWQKELTLFALLVGDFKEAPRYIEKLKGSTRQNADVARFVTEVVRWLHLQHLDSEGEALVKSLQARFPGLNSILSLRNLRHSSPPGDKLTRKNKVSDLFSGKFQTFAGRTNLHYCFEDNREAQDWIFKWTPSPRVRFGRLLGGTGKIPYVQKENAVGLLPLGTMTFKAPFTEELDATIECSSFRWLRFSIGSSSSSAMDGLIASIVVNRERKLEASLFWNGQKFAQEASTAPGKDEAAVTIRVAKKHARLWLELNHKLKKNYRFPAGVPDNGYFVIQSVPPKLRGMRLEKMASNLRTPTFIRDIKLRGKLDPDWVAKALKELAEVGHGPAPTRLPTD